MRKISRSRTKIVSHSSLLACGCSIPSTPSSASHLASAIADFPDRDCVSIVILTSHDARIKVWFPFPVASVKPAIATYVQKTVVEIEALLKVEIDRRNGKAIYTAETEPRIRKAAALYLDTMERLQKFVAKGRPAMDPDYLAISSLYGSMWVRKEFENRVAEAKELQKKDQQAIRIDILFGDITDPKLRGLKRLAEQLSATSGSKLDRPES
jgi:hypothetical protein